MSCKERSPDPMPRAGKLILKEGVNMEEKEKCFMCGMSEEETVLIYARKGGSFFWVCVKCLPILIHG